MVGHGAAGLVGEVIFPDPPKVLGDGVIHGAAAGLDLHFVGVHVLGGPLEPRVSDERRATAVGSEAGDLRGGLSCNFAGFEGGGRRWPWESGGDRAQRNSDRLVGSKPESVYMGHNCSSQSGRDRGTPRALDISDRIGF